MPPCRVIKYGECERPHTPTVMVNVDDLVPIANVDDTAIADAPIAMVVCEHIFQDEPSPGYCNQCGSENFLCNVCSNIVCTICEMDA